jgi:glycogenin glucosyltransferase
MSDDTQLFQPPLSYPEAPKDMYYEVPVRKPEPQKLAQIFPWETRAPKPSRIFADEPAQTSAPPDPETDGPSQPEPASPETSFQSDLSLRLSSWESYSRSNAWDEVPEIERYVEAIQRPKTGNSSGTRHSKPSLRITDFPTEDDRPSLPVTPAPVRRSFWGQGAGGADEFPVAEGVPDQEDWVGVTADALLHLLGAVYSFWEFTEPAGSARRASETTVGAVRTTNSAVAKPSRVVRRD